jgi:hypothetical protein
MVSDCLNRRIEQEGHLLLMDVETEIPETLQGIVGRGVRRHGEDLWNIIIVFRWVF